MNRIYRHSTLLLIVSAFSLLLAQNSDVPRQISLPSSKRICALSPGVFARLNGFAANIALSPDRRYAAILNDGYGTQRDQAHQSIAILDLNTNQLVDFPESRLGEEAHQSYFIGLAFSSDGNRIYASMGSVTDPTGEKPGDIGNGIAVYSFHEGKVAWDRFIKIPPQTLATGKKLSFDLQKTPEGTALPYPAGLVVISGQGGEKLLVADNYSDNAVLLDSSSGNIVRQFDLSAHELIPSEFPYTCVASHDGQRAWCSLWNASQVAELDLEKASAVRVVSLAPPSDSLHPGSHPSSLLLTPDEKLLYVTLSNADSVAVISTNTGKVIATLGLISQKNTLSSGFNPIALAQTADGNRLFVAYSAINAVGVFDVSGLGNHEGSHPRELGLIPTQWYPSALAFVGDDLLIATSKGEGTGPDNGTSVLRSEHRHREHPYIPTLLYGSLARLSLHDIEKHLPEFTQQAEHNNLFQSDPGNIQFAHSKNPFRHVIYIIKENRTYDQVLGDLRVAGKPVGNGDTSLTTYGVDITPNQHKLALQFGVLDNFYDSGEVSGDGHDWSTAAITTDYNEATWQIGYRSKERTYDYQGSVADEIPLENNEPDIDDPFTGYIWDNAARHGLTYRDYGEYLGAIWCRPNGSKGSVNEGIPAQKGQCPRDFVNKGDALPSNVGDPHGSPSPWPWAIPLLREMKPTKAVLRGHFDPLFPEFATDYPDQLRADEFLNEFDGFVRAKKEGKGAELPQFVLLYLPDDHTGGTRPAHPRPTASVADNDLAVGRVVDGVSHSPYWQDTAIFVVEDDAQDGADHVDAHRSIALVISKYSPGSPDHPFVDSRFYTTVNLIHTLESLLGLPPMNQNDACAPVMAPLFVGEGNQPAFNADWSNRDNGLIYKTNSLMSFGAGASEKMDFSRPDANNAAALNAILWGDRKGNVTMPGSKHSVMPQKAGRDND